MTATPKGYDARYAADMKQMALNDGAQELAHRLFAHECPAHNGTVSALAGHSEHCKIATREIRKFARIWAGFET